MISPEDLEWVIDNITSDPRLITPYILDCSFSLLEMQYPELSKVFNYIEACNIIDKRSIVTSNKKKTSDTVYLFRKKSSDIYKIWITSDVNHRLSSINIWPEHIELVKSRKVSDARKVEMALHKYFKDKHHKRERFKLNNSDIKEIEKIILLFDNNKSWLIKEFL